MTWWMPLVKRRVIRCSSAAAHRRRVDLDAALGPAERHVDERGLPRHQRRQRPHLLEVGGRVVADAALVGPAGAVVLHAVAAGDDEVARVEAHRDLHGDLAVGRREHRVHLVVEVDRGAPPRRRTGSPPRRRSAPHAPRAHAYPAGARVAQPPASLERHRLALVVEDRPGDDRSAHRRGTERGVDLGGPGAAVHHSRCWVTSSVGSSVTTPCSLTSTRHGRRHVRLVARKALVGVVARRRTRRRRRRPPRRRRCPCRPRRPAPRTRRGWPGTRSPPRRRSRASSTDRPRA